ncbi:unnamed protein product [Cylindrotheca closterium]|uniref:Uncharacterized protein n=1 Tax=Cylindrotheca closterium TaxID=2856 RepID=A0AAD2CKW8_9STRA|nr:unnamed protein product [Cylindrotheca closterium]
MADSLYSESTGDNAEINYLALLEGRYTLPDLLDPATASFLSHCRFHKGHSPVHLQVSKDDHVYFWSRNPENKGSKPHGLHNGHFKAAIQSPSIAYCDALFRNIPLTTGFVPLQWQNLMNFAIEKKPGDFRLSKMRTIQLMNSEAQANNKKAGRAAMQFAKAHSLIPDGQCGSRKRHQAIDLALSKRLVWDLLILQRRAAGWISNDAKSCFDRVVHWVAIHVRTGFGDSKRSFCPPSTVPFQGCGQGNGAGPPIWISVSSVLITMMEAMSYGFECLLALESQLVTAQCFCFADNTDVIEAGDTVHHSGEDICASVQAATTLWSRGFRATGGAINPEKSFWWLIDFEWHARNDDSEHTLGVMLLPLENHNAQEAQLVSKAKEWAKQLWPHLLHKYDVLPLIRTTIMKKLEYPMALTTLNAQQWQDNMSPVLQVCLPKSGICRNFPRLVVFAPVDYQGLGVPHPFGKQVYKHLEMILRHMPGGTKTGAYLDANDLGTAAVQLLPKGGTARIVIHCQTPGLPQDQSVYCSELIGLLAGIMAVDWLLQQWFPALSQRPGVKIACDGLLAIEMAFEDRPLSPTDAQFDLISSIREAISRSLVSWSPRHVYGHLDKSNLFDELTWWEKKNQEVDGMAVDFRKELEAAHQLIPSNPRFFTELAALFVADTKQSWLSDHFIQEFVTLPRLRQHWRNRNVISEESENLIDWETLGRAMRSLPAGLQRWITKHWVGMCGTGKFKVYWGLESSAVCPRCGEFEDHLPSSLG